MGAPVSAPNAIPPVMAAAFVMFIVARTTCALHELVRKEPVPKLCITNWRHEPFQGSSNRLSTDFARVQKSCLQRDRTLVEFLPTLRGRSVSGSEGQAQHAIH